MPAYTRFNDDDDESVGNSASNATVAASPTNHSTHPEERSAVKIFMSYEDSNDVEEANNNMTEIPLESLTEDAT